MINLLWKKKKRAQSVSQSISISELSRMADFSRSGYYLWLALAEFWGKKKAKGSD